MAYRQNLGKWGEQTAETFLIAKGYKILERNHRTPHGEIDLIAQDQSIRGDNKESANLTIVFVEVKTRSSRTFGTPEVSVNARKQSHLLASINHYIQTSDLKETIWRVDVIAIERFNQDDPPNIVHFENALVE